MDILDLTEECLTRDYHGCGKAWAAVKDGKVVALRYMGGQFWTTQPDKNLADHRPADKPQWVQSVEREADGLDNHGLPIAYSSKVLAKIASAASACENCPKPPRRERYRPTELLTMARAVLTALNGAAFTEYRARCRAELAELGEVVSGMCSCTQFYPK